MHDKMSALECDEQWLINHGHSKLIDTDDFSEWVCRNMADGMSEDEACNAIIRQLSK